MRVRVLTGQRFRGQSAMIPAFPTISLFKRPATANRASAIRSSAREGPTIVPVRRLWCACQSSGAAAFPP